MGNKIETVLSELERQQTLDRERAVAEHVHNQGLCLGPGGCIFCRESLKCVTPVPPDLPTGTALDLTLQARGAEYGDYGNMAHIAQSIKDALRGGNSWVRVSPDQRESLDLIATKLARIVCGNPNNPDSWVDIEGYAKLARVRIAPGAATP